MPMRVAAVAYPELNEADSDSIENYRRLNDALYDVVRTHFTLVFPVSGISVTDFINEVTRQLAGVKSFDFCLRCATISKDSFNDNYLIFLVPDEGYSNLVKFHDRLYCDKLADHLLLDLDYIPHIRIGDFIDKTQCKRMVDEWNERDFSIRGSISAVDIVSYENDIVTTIRKVQLKKAK